MRHFTGRWVSTLRTWESFNSLSPNSRPNSLHWHPLIVNHTSYTLSSNSNPNYIIYFLTYKLQYPKTRPSRMSSCLSERWMKCEDRDQCSLVNLGNPFAVMILQHNSLLDKMKTRKLSSNRKCKSIIDMWV
jgi:hypothetical protein